MMQNKNKLKVVHSDGLVETFKPRLIKEQLLKETDISEEEALKIQRRVSEKLKKIDLDEVSTSTIRAEVSAQLTSRGLLKAEKESRKLGMSVAEFESLIKDGCNDNANIFFSPEQVAKYAFDSIAKEHALLTMPKECADAHIDGYIHCLSGNNDLIVKIEEEICIKTIKEVIQILELHPSMKIFVPSVNPKTLDIEWKKILNGKKTGYKECYEVEFRKGYKIEVTDDHKFLKYNSRYNKFSDNYDICIKDIKNFNTVRIGSLNYIPYNCNDNYNKSALFGFFLGDGTLNNNKITFHLKKEGKIKYLINLLDSLNLSYKNHFNGDTTYIIIENNFYEGDKQKNDISVNFSINYTGLLEGLINSDGYVTLHGKYDSIYLEYDSTNKSITDLFFIACLTHNIRPSYQKIHQNSRNEKWSDIYRCVIQNKYVDELITNMFLRDEHKKRIDGYIPSKTSVHQTTGLTIKEINSIGKQDVYNITVEDNHNFMAGTQGFVLVQNCHDLEYFSTRSNCANWSIPFIARNGLKVDGIGRYGSVAGPAKSLEVLLNQMLEFFMCGSLVLSGGQSFSSFNVYLAPFAKNRSYKDIKQAIQNFIFNCNCALIARGGQTIFSSINIEFNIPDFLKDEPAVGPEGVEIGVYGDYEEEAKLIFKAIIDVTKEKDYIGRYHTFPNQIYMIRENTLDEYNDEIKMVHELLSENPTIYFSNVKNENAVTMGCRTRMSQTFSGDYEKDCMNVGNFHYVTINLPLIAYESKDIEDFYNKLHYYMDISREALLDRKERVEDVLYNKHMSDFLLQKDIKTGKQLFDIERCSFSIGICGLNECCLELDNKKIQDDYELAEDICKYMTQVLEEYKQKDSLRWSLFYSPAESAAHRFALINKEKYSDAVVQGTNNQYYLTNSTHIDVKDNTDLVAHIKNADLLHPYAGAGAICHIWCGETHPNPEALFKLNQKIAKTNTKFWAFTNDYTYCLDCGFTIQKAEDKCLKCDSDNIVTMSRITGYYQPVAGFNNGKKQEFKDRYRHNIGGN